MSWVFDSNSYFVDPSQADDTGDGRTEANAKKTVAAVIGLSPPAGSTIFLAGGTHTVVATTLITVPTGVNFVGGGPEVTTLNSVPNTGVEYLRVNGTNTFSGINLTSGASGDGILFATTTAGTAVDLTFDNCRLVANEEILEVRDSVGGRHIVTLKQCTMKYLSGILIALNTADVDLIMEDCEVEGDGKMISGSVTTADQTVSLKNVIANNISGSTDAIALGSTGAGDVSLSMKGCQFHLGTGNAVVLTESGAGSVTLLDLGENSLTSSNIDTTAGGTWQHYSETIVDNTWNRNLSSHTLSNTAGKVLNDIGNGIRLVDSGTSTAGSTTTITIATSPGADDFYKGCLIVLTSGTGINQARYVKSHTDIARVVTFDRPLEIAAAASTGYAIYSTMSPEQIVTDSVWDDLTANRATVGSAGLLHLTNSDSNRLLDTGTATGGNQVQITLAVTASAIDDFYIGCLLVITSGTGIDQSTFVDTYDGTTKIATFTRTFAVAVDNTSVYKIYSMQSIKALTAIIQEKFADFGTPTSSTQITLDTSASSTNDLYNGCLILFVEGSGAGQSAWIDTYVGATKVATFENTLATSINATTKYRIYANRRTYVSDIRTALPSSGAKMSGEGATIKNLEQLPTTAEINTAVEGGQVGVDTNNIDANVTLTLADTASIVGKLPRTSKLMAGEGTLATNLDLVNTAPILDTEVNVTGSDIIFNLQSGEIIDGYYIGYNLIMTSGSQINETLRIVGYVGATRTVTLASNLSGAPLGGDKLNVYRVESNASNVLDKLPEAGRNMAGAGATAKELDNVILAASQTADWANKLTKSAGAMYLGTATGGTVTTLIDTSLTAANDTYNNRIVMFLTGTLAGQTAEITDYVLGTTTLTISQVTVSPTTETYIIV